jgi:hypothetical protein
MLCHKIYETRTHGLCGTTVPGVAITCEHSKTKCSLDCSSECAGYVESGSTKTPTAAQQQHNKEFIEYTDNVVIKAEPILPAKITPTASRIVSSTASSSFVQNGARDSLSTPAQSYTPSGSSSGGCGCGGASKAKTNYTAPRPASYVR